MPRPTPRHIALAPRHACFPGRAPHRPQGAYAAIDLGTTTCRLLSLARQALAAHPCEGSGRVDHALPGCAIFAAIQQVWALPQIMVADRGLREGVLLRPMPRSVREPLASSPPAPAPSFPQPLALASPILAPA